jgi:hypothetical protein
MMAVRTTVRSKTPTEYFIVGVLFVLLVGLPAVASAGSQNRLAGTSLVATGATNVGFCGGDDWEPEIAADGLGRVYVVLAHFPGDPSCDSASGSPRDIYVRVSNDGGTTFGPLVPIPNLGYPSVVDCVVTVDEVTGTVYVSFLGYDRPDMKWFEADVVVARSTDFGQTWNAEVVNGPLCTKCDHPWIVAHDDNVYVTYAAGKNHYLARSSDGGISWDEDLVLQDTHVAFPEGGVVDGDGNAWFAWGDCLGSCTGKTAAIYQVSRTEAGTSNTDFARVAEGPSGPHCPPSITCGFAYWGPQDDIAIDAAGNLYLVWQDSLDGKPHRPPIVQLSRCLAGTDCTRSASWVDVGRVDDKSASGCEGGQCYALYPRIEGGAAGRIGVIWMDDRLGDPLDHMNGWNVWYRTSTNGGSTWAGASQRVSQFDPARSESHPNGFEFPYGDYQGIDITPAGFVVMTWGEGHDYLGGPDKPGHVIYRSLPL